MPIDPKGQLLGPGLASSRLADGRVQAHLVKTPVDITMCSSICMSRYGHWFGLRNNYYQFHSQSPSSRLEGDLSNTTQLFIIGESLQILYNQ